MHVSRRRFLSGSFFLSASGLVLAGCGGGGGTKSGGGNNNSAIPTAITRAHVQNLHGQVARQLTSSGVSGTALAFTRNSYVGGYATGGGFALGAPVPSANAGNAADATSTANLPNLGGFLKNVAGVSPAHRAAHLAIAKGRDAAPGGKPTNQPPPNPVDYTNPSFYYDYYLELWVAVTDTPSTITYALFSDEAKTKSAGSIVTTQPTDYATFPQVYDSSYSFTAGYLAGSHGTSKNTTNANGSFSGSYDNVYSDGWSDKGQSNGSATGDFSWQSRTDSPVKEWTQGAGTFRSDGSGGTRFSTSEGYAADYTYNKDGSGQGHISGSDPGMPVTITWDAFGNTTIKYADGTIEQYNAYTYYGGGGGGPIPIDANGGSGSSAGSAPVSEPPSPSTLPSPPPVMGL